MDNIKPKLRVMLREDGQWIQNIIEYEDDDGKTDWYSGRSYGASLEESINHFKRTDYEVIPWNMSIIPVKLQQKISRSEKNSIL